MDAEHDRLADAASCSIRPPIAIVGEVTMDRLWHAVPSAPTLSESGSA